MKKRILSAKCFVLIAILYVILPLSEIDISFTTTKPEFFAFISVITCAEISIQGLRIRKRNVYKILALLIKRT